MTKGRIAWLAALACAVCAANAACYNSQWGEGKREQQRALVRAAPPELSRAEGTGAITQTKLRVRALATPRYTAQVVDAPRQFQESVDEANRVLAGIGVRLEVESFTIWETPDEDLSAALGALAAKERGDGADWYVGLLGALPRASASFHELGYARVLGRHLVLRAPSRADEVDAIERNLDELGDEERRRLTTGRRRHRAAAILLHELGHTLGALHDDVSASLMNPEYATQRSSFGPENVGFMQTTLRHRGAREPDDRSLAKDLSKRLDEAGPRGAFVARDREEMRALLTRLAAPPVPPSGLVAVATAAPAELIAEDVRGLSPPDRETFRQAKALQAMGDSKGAWEKGKALFSRYPKSLSVQDLRCQVAMGRLSYDAARPECDAVVKLTRDGAQ